MIAACSDEKGFVIRGDIKELGNRNIEITYYAAGGIQQQTALGNKGKFEFRGLSASPTLVDLSMPDGRPLAYIVIKDGEEVTVSGERLDPYELSVKGNRASSDLARFLRDNAVAIRNGDVKGINSAITDYVINNPSNPASGALLVTRFFAPGNELLADSLLGLITLEGRPSAVMQNYGALLSSQVSSDARSKIPTISIYAGGDTLARLQPSRHSCSLLAVMGTTSRQRDSITPWLRVLTDSLSRRRFAALEISLAADSISWAKAVKGDSVTWSRGWAPGGAAASQIRKLGIATEPFFIVCDSTGAQLYRGSSITSAAETVKNKLHLPKLTPPR